MAGVAGLTAPTGAVTANDGFTGTALKKTAGTVDATSKCTATVGKGVSEDVSVTYGG